MPHIHEWRRGWVADELCGSQIDDGTESNIGVQDIVIDADTGLNLDGDVAFIDTPPPPPPPPRVDPPDDRRVECRCGVFIFMIAVV